MDGLIKIETDKPHVVRFDEALYLWEREAVFVHDVVQATSVGAAL
jgi:hypothetical protein